MGDVVNIFTKQTTSIFGTANYTETITLTPMDKAYFAVRSFNERNGQSFEHPFKDTPPIEDAGWAEVTVAKDGPTRIDFQFLEDMGLAVIRDDKHYINKFAYFLYDPQDGLFVNYNSQAPPQNKMATFAPFMRTMLTYVLPGEYWSTYYDKQISDDRKKTKLVEIEESWNDIMSEYGLPDNVSAK
jgi:hypothetical protein